MSENQYYDGQLVFDRKRTDITDDILVVTDADAGVLDDFDGETHRAIKYNDTNQQLNPDGHGPVDGDTPMVQAAYLNDGVEGRDPEVGDEIYTFPQYRLATIQSDGDAALDGLFPHQHALASFFGELASAIEEDGLTVDSVEGLRVIAMRAECDGEVILDGAERANPA